MTELEQVELQIKALTAEVDNAKALTRLLSNRDFNKLVVGKYMTDEALRLVGLLASDVEPACILQELTAIAHFKQFLNTVEVRSHVAEKSLADAEEYRLELLAEA